MLTINFINIVHIYNAQRSITKILIIKLRNKTITILSSNKDDEFEDMYSFSSWKVNSLGVISLSTSCYKIHMLVKILIKHTHAILCEIFIIS